MKANEKRKVFKDAIDLLTDEPIVEKSIQMIPVDRIVPFHNHPFRMYEGERLDDMVESIREHGVIVPVIVQKMDSGYEMLAGHNRWNASKIVGIEEIPAIIKDNLTEEEEYIYVIETNLLQRSFSDLLPSEKAAVLVERYEKISCQGKRNDILEEIARLSGLGEKGTCGTGVHKLKNRDSMAEDYGMTGRNIARYLRVDKTIEPIKEMIDAGKMPIKSAVELSYLRREEQEMVCSVIEEEKVKVSVSKAMELRKKSGELDIETVDRILFRESKEKAITDRKVFADIRQKYFGDKPVEEVVDILERALEAWFGEKGEKREE